MLRYPSKSEFDAIIERRLIMKFKCPVDYKLDDCSSKEYGLTCDTCFHTKKDISFLYEGTC